MDATVRHSVSNKNSIDTGQFDVDDLHQLATPLVLHFDAN